MFGDDVAQFCFGHVHVPDEFDVKALRRQLSMSQAKFAASFGFDLDAVQSWEQG
jgi:putative transcriptional regulator